MVPRHNISFFGLFASVIVTFSPSFAFVSEYFMACIARYCSQSLLVLRDILSVWEDCVTPKQRRAQRTHLKSDILLLRLGMARRGKYRVPGFISAAQS
jgi:hypothetical protein